MNYTKGDKVRIIDNFSEHGFDIGEIAVIARKVSPGDEYYEEGLYQFEPDQYGCEWYAKEAEFEPWEIQSSRGKKFELLCKFIHDKGLEGDFNEYMIKSLKKKT